MRRIFFTIAILIMVALGANWYLRQLAPSAPVVDKGETKETSAVTTLVGDLEIPWDIVFLPDGGMLITERTGHVVAVAQDGTKHEIPVDGIKKQGEGGLLGIVLHPNYDKNHFLYLYMSAPGTNSSQTQNRVVRYKYEGGKLIEDKVIISGIPGATYHDGGRLAFGPDGLLYITTGDATIGNIAQDLKSLGGKILRLKDDGSIPADNPFGTAVYSYGHRNPQGLTWDTAGRLWESEHGPTGEQGRCCRDELNLIKKGGNYGWPAIIGDERKADMITPELSSGDDTWAPASIAYLNGSLFFGGLKGEALYEAVLDGERITKLKVHFKGEFGRIRTVKVGPDGMLYLTTSNRDGRGNPKDGDDKIILINPGLL